MSTDSSLSRLSKLTILAIAFFQSVLLLLYFENIDFLTGYSQIMSFAFLAVLSAVPLFALFLITDPSNKQTWLLLLGYSLLILALSLYTGSQCAAGECRNVWPQFIFPQIVSWFILLFFAQVWLKRGNTEFSYTELFDASWNNYLSGQLTAIFVGLFWALLALWVGLFKLINIEFFNDVFYSRWFAFPVTGLVIGIGIIVFRTQINAVEMMRRILRVLIRWLLPVISLITILFILALPFTGLDTLWSTRYATSLLLWLVCLVLFFTNAVFQDGEDDGGYGRVISTLNKSALLFLPVYIVIAAYALGLRVVQHGWTVDRLWVAMIIALLSGFIFSYAYHLLRHRENWLNYFAKTNRIMAMVIAGACLLVTSPLLDFRKLTVSNQLSRLEAGKTNLNNFDYKYFRFELGKAGHDALLMLRKQNSKNSKVVTIINNTLSSKNRWDTQKIAISSVAQLSALIPVYPKNHEAPEALFEYIYKNKASYSFCYSLTAGCLLVAVDLYGDNTNEYVLFGNSGYLYNTKVFVYKNKQWTNGGVIANYISMEKDKIKQLAESGKIEVMQHNWKDLNIDGNRIIFKDN